MSPPARVNIRALAGIFKLRIGETMPEKEMKCCRDCCVIVDEIKVVTDAARSTGKMNWMKLFELIMQLLPLIFTFFQPEDEKPQA